MRSLGIMQPSRYFVCDCYSYSSSQRHDMDSLTFTLDHLEERRNNYRAELSGLIFAGPRASCTCNWTKKLDAVYKAIRLNFTPTLLPVSLSQMIKEIEDVARGEEHFVNCEALSLNPSCSLHIHNRLAQLKATASICFTCVDGQETGVCNCA